MRAAVDIKAGEELKQMSPSGLVFPINADIDMWRLDETIKALEEIKKLSCAIKHDTESNGQRVCGSYHISDAAAIAHQCLIKIGVD